MPWKASRQEQKTTASLERVRGAIFGDSLGDCDSGFAEDVGDLSFAEAGGVVFQGKVVEFVIDAEATESVGIGEFAEKAELFDAQR